MALPCTQRREAVEREVERAAAVGGGREVRGGGVLSKAAVCHWGPAGACGGRSGCVGEAPWGTGGRQRGERTQGKRQPLTLQLLCNSHQRPRLALRQNQLLQVGPALQVQERRHRPSGSL